MYYFEEEILERSQGTAGRKAWRRWPKSTGVLCFFCCLFLFFRFVANYLLFMGWSSCLLEEGSKALGPKGPLGDELWSQSPLSGDNPKRLTSALGTGGEMQTLGNGAQKAGVSYPDLFVVQWKPFGRPSCCKDDMNREQESHFFPLNWNIFLMGLRTLTHYIGELQPTISWDPKWDVKSC